MKIGKTILIIVLIALCMGNVFAAGKKDEGPAKQKPINEIVIGFSQDTLNQPWRNYEAVCVQQEIEKAGAIAYVTDGGGQVAKQIQNIEDMLVRGMDLLIASPAQSGAMTQVISQVYKSGIPVVLIDRGIESQDYSIYFNTDNYALAAINADYIAERLTQKYGSPRGNVVVLEGVPGASTSVERGDGFKKQLEKYPDIKILASQPGDYRRDLGQKIMEDFLQAYDKIDAVFSMADEMTMGALNAIEAVGRRSEMVITSINGTMEGIKAIIDGRMDTTPLSTNFAGPGVEYALKILRGESVPKHIIIEPLMITEKNAKEMYNEAQYSPDPIPLSALKYRIVD